MKYIKAFIAFLLPIIGKAATRAIVDEVVKYAYPEDKPLTKRQAVRNVGKAVREADEVNRYSDPSVAKVAKTAPGFEPYHDVLLVAFDVTGTNRETVHNWLQRQMPDCVFDHKENISLDSWWIANDDAEGDLDSAVFVKKGSQPDARALLTDYGLNNG